MTQESQSFVLYRIIGNDLFPRHAIGSFRENVRFILEHEPPLEACERRWVVNRIVDSKEEAAVLALLSAHGQSYLHVPFKLSEYARTEWDLECFPERGFFLSDQFEALPDDMKLSAEIRARNRKNNYVMNNNGARNAALRAGRSVAKWVLPWDGSCFLTAKAWAEIRAAIEQRPFLKYVTVPMARVTCNENLLMPSVSLPAEEEPQIIFRRDASEEFDEGHPYGRRSKTELLMRLGVPGPWDRWVDHPWDLPLPAPSREAGQVARAGWVARLNSGMPHLEGERAIKHRGAARSLAIRSMLDRLDEAALRLHFDASRLMAYREDLLPEPGRATAGSPIELVAERLRREALEAIARGTYSVLDKTTLPPSGDPHDYWHPAPYWWPNPKTPDGLPYIKRDGKRVPGTELYGPQSDKYDRSRLQRVFDDTTVLALSWRVSGEACYAEHGARLVRQWFICPETAATPHMRYAQVRMGYNGNEGTSFGIIEMKDLYYFLDAVRLLERAGALGPEDRNALRRWFGQYRDWLVGSRQGREECRRENNHGTLFDLQLAAVAAYLDDAPLLVTLFRRSRERIQRQFEPDGSQPHETHRTLSAHYHAFNLQSWVNLATLAERCGEDLWHYETADGRGIRRAIEWFLSFMTRCEWPYKQIEPFDRDRLIPLQIVHQRYYTHAWLSGSPPSPDWYRTKPVFSVYGGIKPYWFL